ncbi:hypothetical protein C8J56DRAFT_483452 [Mycena floridula]|nr:hypothetical protein C8J56DRAFT_483452 [Mycena floridula]
MADSQPPVSPVFRFVDHDGDNLQVPYPEYNHLSSSPETQLNMVPASTEPQFNEGDDSYFEQQPRPTPVRVQTDCPSVVRDQNGHLSSFPMGQRRYPDSEGQGSSFMHGRSRADSFRSDTHISHTHYQPTNLSHPFDSSPASSNDLHVSPFAPSSGSNEMLSPYHYRDNKSFQSPTEEGYSYYGGLEPSMDTIDPGFLTPPPSRHMDWNAMGVPTSAHQTFGSDTGVFTSTSEYSPSEYSGIAVSDGESSRGRGPHRQSFGGKLCEHKPSESLADIPGFQRHRKFDVRNDAVAG